MLCCKVDYRGQLKGVKVQPGGKRPSSPSRSSANGGPGTNSVPYVCFLFVCLFMLSFSLDSFDLEQSGNTSSVHHGKKKKSEVNRSIKRKRCLVLSLLFMLK